MQSRPRWSSLSKTADVCRREYPVPGVLSLRSLAVAVADASAMARVLSDPSLYRFTGGEPPSVDALTRQYTAQVRGCSPDGRAAWINRVVLVDEGPVGYVQATVPMDDDVAEIAWVIGRPWQGLGYAKRAAELLVEELTGRGVHRLVAMIRPDHVASQRIAAHLGMRDSSEMVDGEIRWTGTVG